MKKMMMILAALSAVTLAQAAAIKWSSGTLFKPDTDGKFLTGNENRVVVGEVIGYLFVIDENTYKNVLTTPQAVYDKFKTMDKATFTETFSGGEDGKMKGAVNPFFRYITMETGPYDPGEYYAAVVYEFMTTDAGGTASATHWIANAAHESIGGGTDGSKNNLGLYWHGTVADENKFSGWNAVTSTSEPVPEPMCAALFALGAAALGLRRRR